MGVRLAKNFMNIFFTCLILLVAFTTTNFAQDLSGTVMNEKGRPITKVMVYSYPDP
jgi:hypothetical protein